MKENKKLKMKAKKLETKNILISQQDYRWLIEQKHWKYKYESQKVKIGIYKRQEEAVVIKAVLEASQVEAST